MDVDGAGPVCLADFGGYLCPAVYVLHDDDDD